MKTDNALRKVLSKPQDELPYGFEQRLLRRLLADVERRSKNAYYRSLGLVAFVSLLLVAGLLLILSTFYSIDLLAVFATNPLQHLETKPVWNNRLNPILDLSLFVAALSLFLLVLDFVFRRTLGSRFRNGGKNGG